MERFSRYKNFNVNNRFVYVTLTQIQIGVNDKVIFFPIKVLTTDMKPYTKVYMGSTLGHYFCEKRSLK